MKQINLQFLRRVIGHLSMSLQIMELTKMYIGSYLVLQGLLSKMDKYKLTSFSLSNLLIFRR